MVFKHQEVLAKLNDLKVAIRPNPMVGTNTPTEVAGFAALAEKEEDINEFFGALTFILTRRLELVL